MYLCNSLQDEMFQKFNFDTEWAVRLISRITNDEDIPIEGDTIVKQVNVRSCAWYSVFFFFFLVFFSLVIHAFLHTFFLNFF